MSCATAPLRTITLSGELGRRFGRKHRFAVGSPGEAIRALIANFPEFRAFVSTSEERGVGYRVIAGGRDRRLDEINHPTGRSDIRIVPMIQGAGKGGIFEILGGVALIAAAIALGPVGFGLLGASGSLIGGVAGTAILGAIGAIGAALVLGGITNLLSPQPQTNQRSYAISGNVNTTAQGVPVPIGYGEMFCGSVVISAAITVDNVPTQETGVPGLSAVVQITTDANGNTITQVYASWQPAGQAVGYDVTIQGNGFGPYTAPRTNGTSVYVNVNGFGTGPFTVICNPVEPDGSYGPGATTRSVYIGAAP